MKCPNCNFENPDGSLYCGKCATPIPPSEETPIPSTKTIQASVVELTRGVMFAKRYEVIEELGKGGMGKAYRVFDKKIEEEVALKVLSHEIAADRKTIERFRNELKFTRKIGHRNVCKMYDLNEEEGTHYITMEYVQGQDLRGFIRQTGQLTVKKAISISKQVCEGLAEAHRLKVIHRDLKPSNIMIDKDGNARILDFGIARSLRAKGVTDAGVMVGTPEYMSPEQAETKNVDQRSDIYSLGVILYEMVTGRIPFVGDTALSIAMKHSTEVPPDPKEFNDQISEDISSVILKCLEKNREKRYQNTEELISEFDRIEKRIPTTEKVFPKEKQKKEKAIKPKWKKPLLFGGAALLLTLLVLTGIAIITNLQGAIDSIAVLPFENINTDTETEFLSDGITESIISRLARLPQLKKVIARSSVFRYKGGEIDPQAIGRELGVDAVLVSQISRRDDELSISVELMKVRDNSHIWGTQYSRKVSEIFTIQEEITNSITDNLQLRLTGEELERMTKRYTENSEAFVAYSRGQYFWNKRTEKDLERAIEYFNQALHLDPNYALAYTGLSHVYLLLPEYGNYQPKETYPKSKAAALKALEIDNLLAEAHVSLAQIKRRYDGDWVSAEIEYKRALELDPGHATAHHWYGYDLMCMARFDEAIREIRRAHELDPLSLVINRNLGQVFFRTRRYEQALEALKKTLEMDPNFSFTHFYLGSIYLQKSMYEEALAEFQKEKELSKGWSMRVDAWIGVTYMKMGQREKALEVLNELLEKSKQIYVPQTLVAILYFVLGEDDLGFQWLNKAYEEYDSRMRLLKIDPVFDRVRSNPRFEAILKKMGLER